MPTWFQTPQRSCAVTTIPWTMNILQSNPNIHNLLNIFHLFLFLFSFPPQVWVRASADQTLLSQAAMCAGQRREMERVSTHRTHPHRCLRNHRVPGGTASNKSSGRIKKSLLMTKFLCHCIVSLSSSVFSAFIAFTFFMKCRISVFNDTELEVLQVMIFTGHGKNYGSLD